MLQRPQFNKGGSLVEIIIVAAIIVGSLSVILGLAAVFLTISQTMQQTSKATTLAQEALEIVRNYRDGIPWDQDDPTDEYDGLGIIDYGQVYHPELDSPPQWKFATGPETINEFTRQVVFEEVYRDTPSPPGTDDIVTSGGNLDPDTVKATATVSWTERGNNHQVELVAYFTNWNQ